MTEKTQAPVSVVEAKMARIEELSRQIARSAADLETFWHNLSDRLAAVAVEAWADEFLEGSIRLTFPNPDPAKKPRDEPEDEHGFSSVFIISAIPSSVRRPLPHGNSRFGPPSWSTERLFTRLWITLNPEAKLAPWKASLPGSSWLPYTRFLIS